MANNDENLLGNYGSWVKADLSEFAEKTEIYNSLAVLFAKINHNHTVSQISDISSNYQPKISDSGWQDLNFTNITDFEPYNTTTYKPQARKIGNQVYVRGAITNTVQATSTSAGLLMAKLPNGFAPSQNMYLLQQGTNAYRYMLIVNTSGELRISRYTNSTTTQGTIGANSWLAIYCNFLTD